MAICKLTMFFQQGVYGWSESFFRDAGVSTLQGQMDLALVLAPKRIKCSGEQTQLPFLKVSMEGVQRDVLLYSYLARTNAIPAGQSGKDSDIRFTAALIRRTSADNKSFSNYYLRGIWDELSSGLGFGAGDPTWNANFGSFRGEITGSKWGFMAKVPADSKSKQNVATLVQGAEGKVTLTTASDVFPAPTFGTKQKIFVSGILGSVLVNGVQIVIPSAARSCTTIKRIPILPYLGGGLLTWNQLAFVETADMQPLRGVARKTGRPPYLSRGRSAVRKIS